MTVHVNHAPQIAGLQLCLLNTLDQIDCALDKGDRKAFRVWCNRRASLTARLQTQLVALAAAPQPVG